MRVQWMIAGILALSQSACFPQASPEIPVSQLVREVAYNELQDQHQHGSWRYWIESNAQKGKRKEEQVETADGPVTRLTESEGIPLTPAGQRLEQARLNNLLGSPLEQAVLRQKHIDNEERINRILTLLPTAFLFDYAGKENGCLRLRFHPNPSYPVHTIEERVLHAMSGDLLIDARLKRLVSIEGHLDNNVDLGFGFLSRIYKGGWFLITRIQVSPAGWKTERIEVHFSSRALLFSSVGRETSEVRGGFAPVPSQMSFAEGIVLLDQPLVEPVATSKPQINAADLAAYPPEALSVATGQIPR